MYFSHPAGIIIYNFSIFIARKWATFERYGPLASCYSHVHMYPPKMSCMVDHTYMVHHTTHFG